jgi:hypothetical protein
MWWMAGVLAVVLTSRAVSPASQPVKEDPERLNVIFVELSLLADPELCCHYPVAYVEAGTLVLEGYLPSVALRDKALKLAMMVTRLPVKDRLNVHPGCRYSLAQVSNQDLWQNATQKLQARFPKEYHKWQLSVRAPGELVVMGHVDSYEDKLLVSQKLRDVAGCKCVVNHLQVSAAATAAPDAVQQTQAAMPVPPSAPVKTPATPLPALAPVPDLPLPAAPPSAVPPVTLPLAAVPPAVTPPAVTPPAVVAPVKPKFSGPAAQLNPGTAGSGVPVTLGPSVLPTNMSPAAAPVESTVPGMPGSNNSTVRIGSGQATAQPASATLLPTTPPSVPAVPQLSLGAPEYRPMPPGLVASNNTSPHMGGPGTFDHVAAYPKTAPVPTTVWQATGSAPGLAVKATGGAVALASPQPFPTGPIVKVMAPGPMNLTVVRELIQHSGGPNLSHLTLNWTGNKLSVRFLAPTETEGDRLAHLIMDLPALRDYRLELKVDFPSD